MAVQQQILGSYAPEDLIIILQNEFFTHSVSGFAEGTFVNVSRIVPPSTLYTGSDNTAVRVVRSNKGSNIALTLHQGSESNDVLSQALIMDEQTKDGTWLFSVLIKDGTGRSLFHSPKAFIANTPNTTFGSEIDTREWTLHCITLDSFIGGNGQLSDDAYRTLQGMGATPDPRWAP